MTASKRIFVLFVSLFILITSCIGMVGASDVSSEASALDEGTDLGYLPTDSYSELTQVNPILSYNGTSFLDDLDDSDTEDQTDITISELYTDHSWRPWRTGGFIEVRYYYLDSNNNIQYLRDLMEVDFDSPLYVSLRKNTNPNRGGALEHSVRYEQNVEGTTISKVGWFPDFSIDDYQGFYLTLGDGQMPTAGINGSLCEPSWNISFVKNTITYPGYFAEFAQVYGNFTISTTQLAAAGNGSYLSFWCIPTYAGQYSIREYETNNIILTHNNYGQIRDSYSMYVIGFNTGNVRFYITNYDGDIAFNNLVPNPQRFAGSMYLDHGPLFPFSLKTKINNKIKKYGNFPKYYLPSTSDISIYVASEEQYNAYQTSDTKIDDDIRINKEAYDEKSEEFTEAIKGFDDLPKPDITSNSVVLPSGSVESIDELSGILSIIWEDKMVKEMLIISLTFVFVGYILFGKRG